MNIGLTKGKSFGYKLALVRNYRILYSTTSLRKKININKTVCVRQIPISFSCTKKSVIAGPLRSDVDRSTYLKDNVITNYTTK